jgi:hypothetical protein
MMRSLVIWMGMCLAAGISCPAAYGASVNVDFNGTESSGTYSGTGAAPDTGTVWNGITPSGASYTSGALVDSAGGATPITVTLSTYNVYDADENTAAYQPALLNDFIYQTVLGPNGPPGNFSIDNLTPGGAYDLYFYGQNGGYSNTATSFTIGSTTKIATNTNSGGGPSSFVEDANYVVFSSVIATGGSIAGTFNDVAAANNAAFNGLQIVTVPEPTSVVGAVVGSVLLFGLGRRRILVD